jgi:hypothetical protein
LIEEAVHHFGEEPVKTHYPGDNEADNCREHRGEGSDANKRCENDTEAERDGDEREDGGDGEGENDNEDVDERDGKERKSDGLLVFVGREDV